MGENFYQIYRNWAAASFFCLLFTIQIEIKQQQESAAFLFLKKSIRTGNRYFFTWSNKKIISKIKQWHRKDFEKASKKYRGIYFQVNISYLFNVKS